VTCPRCGYRCDAGWRHCAACGWDLTVLVDQAEEERLQAIGRATVGVIVGGRRNRFATAFPFGGAGLYLTNARLLIRADESRLRARTHNNYEYPASIVGLDLPSGVGLLKIAIPGAPTPEVASASPGPPEPSWAVCYPIVFEGDVVRYLPVSLHRGHLNAAAQSGHFLVSFESLLRSDHAIEDGCAGGPLVDARGRIAGMILGSPEDGITYIQPLEALQPVVATLSRKEPPVRPYFGIGLVTLDERRRAKFGIGAEAANPLVPYVISRSPAAQAGIRAGDLLLAVGGESVTTVWGAGQRLLASAPDGPGVVIKVARGGAEHELTVRPVIRPERVLLDPVDEIQETLEVNLKEVTAGPGAQQGLLVSDLVRGGRGEKRHYRNGDLIVAIENRSVKTFEAFGEAIRTKFRDVFADGVGRDRQYPSSYAVTLDVRKEGEDRVQRTYVNLFPDFLAPPVY
jgi:serine protease Do